MIISKALPFRFWLDGVESFNLKDEPGIDKQLFIQKHKLAMPVVLQVMSETQQAVVLVIKNISEVQVAEIYGTYEAIEGYHYYKWNFTFDSIPLTAGKYYFEFYTEQIEGAGAVIAPLAMVSGTGTNGIYVEILGDGAVIGLMPTIESFGENYAFNSGDFRLSDVTDSICGATPQTLYWIGVFGTGISVYTEKEMVNSPVGYNYIVLISDANIYQYNDFDGTVGSDTGLDC